MALQDKPNVNKVWAEEGIKVQPSEDKISTGWVVERPPYQIQNWLQGRSDAFLKHINQAGIPVWDELTEYTAGKSYVQGSDGLIYVAVNSGSGNDPTNDINNDWKQALLTPEEIQSSLDDIQSAVEMTAQAADDAQESANSAATSETNAATSASSASTAAASAAGHEAGAAAARDAAYAISRTANSGAEGVAYSTATTGPDAFFSIRKGGLDGATTLSRTALCRRTGTTTYVVWGTVADGGEIDTIINASSPSPLTGISGTANAIVGNSATIKQVLSGCSVKLTPTATNTGATTLTINYAGGAGTSGTFNVIDDNGGAIGAGTLRQGNTYDLTFTGSVWKITNYGDDHERIKRGAYQPLVIDTGSSTANAIVATTPYPATLSDGTPFHLTPVADNTGAVTLTLNGAGPFNLRRNGGGALTAGALKTGYKYLLNWQATGSVFTVTVDAPILTRLLDVSTLKVLSVGGTGDAITVSTEMGDGPSPGCLCTFIATAANTGPVTLNMNGSGAFRIRQGNGNDLAAGDLQPGSAVQVRWSGPANSIFSGSPGNTWSLLSTGQTVGSVAEAAVDNRDPLGLLRDALTLTPYGTVTYVGGSRVITPRNIVVVGVGSSVGQGAGATVPADSAPSRLFINALQAALTGYGNLNFIHDNQSVGGTTANQFAGQLAASAQASKTFVTITAGMNDCTVSAYNTGNTLPGFRTSIISLIATIKAAGAVPILITTPHMHPTRRPALVIPTDAALIYPAFTYNVSVPYVFNATAKTIYSDTFANSSYGGGAIKAGSTLKVESGSNVGYYTVASVSSDRMTITVVESLAATVTETVRIRQVNLSTEDVLVPPASASFVTRDWTGNGVLLTGDVRAWHINDVMRDVATKYGALLVDTELAFFRGVELNGGNSTGWDYMYTNPNYNHPSTAGYSIGFGAPLTALARRVAEMLRA